MLDALSQFAALFVRAKKKKKKWNKVNDSEGRRLINYGTITIHGHTDTKQDGSELHQWT